MPESNSPDWLIELEQLADRLEAKWPDDHRLVCVECSRTSEGSARGWRALLTVDDEIATYCPECAREEFGDA